MNIGHLSGTSGIFDIISRSGVLNNQTRARIQSRPRAVKVNDPGEKEKSGGPTDKGREPGKPLSRSTPDFI
jgi:hypothetical protein